MIQEYRTADQEATPPERFKRMILASGTWARIRAGKRLNRSERLGGGNA